MAESIQGDSPGKVNHVLNLEPALLTSGFAIDPKLFHINQMRDNPGFDLNLHSMALINSTTANAICQLAAAISGEMQQLAFSSVLNAPVDNNAIIHAFKNLLSAISEHSSSLTDDLMIMAQHRNSHPVTPTRLIANPTLTLSVSPQSVSSSASISSNVVNFEEFLPHQASRTMIAPSFGKRNEQPLLLFDEKTNDNDLKVKKPKMLLLSPLTSGIPPKVVKTRQLGTATGGSRFKCPWCQQMFTDENMFIMHRCEYTNE